MNINFEHYFNEEFRLWDTIDRYLLNSSRRLHKEKFREYSEEILNQILIEEVIAKLQYSNLSKYEME